MGLFLICLRFALTDLKMEDNTVASASAPAAAQQQHAVQPKQETATVPASHGAQVEETEKGRRSTSNSSSDSAAPSRMALSRSVRHLQEEVDTHGDMIGEVKKQLLWTMSQQGRAARALMSRQLVIQGFSPQNEDKRISVAMKNRDAWILMMMMEQTGLDSSQLTFQASHRHHT